MKRKVGEWPPELIQLQQTYNSLCTICTFLSSRKHVLMTVETVMGPVSKEIGRKVEIEELAMIKYLLPHDVVFEYININETIKEQNDPYTPEVSNNPYVMTFEFKDGQLKPKYTVDDMKKMIEKRRNKFVDTVEGLLKDYEDNKEVVELVQREGGKLIPVEPEYVDPVEKMNDKHNIDDKRPSMDIIISKMKNSDNYHGQIVENGEYLLEAKPPISEPLQVDEVIMNALVESRGITRFYSHQVQAIGAIRRDENVIVSTSTSSGKSLIYQIPVLERLLKEKDTTAIYIFPTKALAQDQKSTFQKLVQLVKPDVMIDTYDGDTPKELRTEIRDSSNVIFTNFDMVHCSILPNWRLWSTFLRKLKVLVVDELHVYNGLFGSNVAMVMRRLRRICNLLGNNELQFVSCSATMNNPIKMMNDIFGIDQVTLIDKDGSPSGEKHVLMWNTPYISPSDVTSGRVHPITEAVDMFIQLISLNVRTIVFCKVRKACEMLIKGIRQKLGEQHGLLNRVMSYRGGYSIQDRRKIENQMFDGQLIGIVATNALELGIDIGNLDAVIVCGFPFTISNFRQQVGRAGRRNNKDSLAVLIGGGGAVDQYYMKHPRQVFDAENPELAIDLENELMLEGHLQCAAFENPLLDDNNFLRDWEKYKNKLVEGEYGFEPHDRYLPWPSDHVSIRGSEERYHAVVDVTNNRNIVIEQVEESRVFYTLYEGGIFLHQGYPYLIQNYDFFNRIAKVSRVNVERHTRQRDYTDVDPLETRYVSKLDNGTTVYYGDIQIRSVVFGFFKFDKRDRIIDSVEVDQPAYEYTSHGFWINIPSKTLKKLKEHKLHVAGAIHGSEHALMNLFPKFVSLLPTEVSTECKSKEKELYNPTKKKDSKRKRPARLIFYDRQCGGAGISSKAFAHINKLLTDAMNIVDSCDCEIGCPACVCSETCKEENAVVSKIGARVILHDLCGISLEAIPMGPESNLKKYFQPLYDTVIEA